MRKVFLDDLPKWKKGEGNGHIGSINWKKSIGSKVHFIYEDIEGDVYIINYVTKRHRLTIKYKDKQLDIHTDSFKICALGKLLDKITINFKYKIGARFQDNNRDLTIIE